MVRPSFDSTSQDILDRLAATLFTLAPDFIFAPLPAVAVAILLTALAPRLKPDRLMRIYVLVAIEALTHGAAP
jgi:hypothetical protein